MAVLVIGTLDTKGAEVAFVRDRLRAAGVATLILDAGVLGEPSFQADLPREELFRAAGTSLADLRRKNDRGEAVTRAADGAARVATRLRHEGKLDGVLGLGGSAGTTIATAAMRALPYGLPKLMVSTLAGGQVGPYVGVSDILMMPAIVDFCGLNPFSARVLNQAVDAMVGMVRPTSPFQPPATVKKLIAASMFGVTTPCVEHAKQRLSEQFEVLVFHATGTGGRTMEAMIRDGLFAGVLDITTTELADELVGGVLSAGRDRLTAAAIREIPQVISVGALDMVNFGPPDSIPERFKNRRFYQHNPNVTLMRTTPEENDRLGKEMAEKACAAGGPTAIILPLRGVSAIDRDGGPFWWPEANQALFQSIRNWIGPWVKVIEADHHINDPEFAVLAARTLLDLIER
jgi:uncharacterized protein (UPF0261 family)